MHQTEIYGAKIYNPLEIQNTNHLMVHGNHRFNINTECNQDQTK